MTLDLMLLQTYGLAEKLSHLAGSVGFILPELVVAGAFLIMLIAAISFGKKRPLALPMMATAGILAADVLMILLWGESPREGAFLGMVVPDGFSAYFRLLFGFATLITIWVSHNSKKLKEQSSGLGEYYLVMVAMLLGMHFMSMASNLLMMYLALELVSLPSYILTAYTRLSRPSAEASLKYIIYGAFSSGIMLYGISWLYGVTGTLDPMDPAFAAGLAEIGPVPGTFILVLIFAGFAFKISALPFHFWTPDVYEGAPYPVAGFFAVAPKAAGFAMLMRFLSALPATESPELLFNVSAVLGLMAAGGMTLGNLAAIRQENIRRMLAWSSIAQAGYILLAVLLMTSAGFVAATFFLTIYLFMTLGSFILAGWVFEETGSEKIEDYRGLGKGIPMLAILLVVFFVSLTGLPPTGGFIGKLDIFLAVIESWNANGESFLIALLILAVINTVISLFYYLRVPVLMIFYNPSLKFPPRFHGLSPWLGIILALPVLWMGIIHFDGLINFIRAQLETWALYIP